MVNGYYLKLRREELGLSIEDLAGYVCIYPETLRQVEDVSSPSSEHKKLINLLSWELGLAD